MPCAPPEIRWEKKYDNLVLYLGTCQKLYLFDEGGGSTALPVSFRFEGPPCVDATFLEAALDGVRLAERRSYEAEFGVMGETQVGYSLFCG